jgi:hypothetical protein
MRSSAELRSSKYIVCGPAIASILILILLMMFFSGCSAPGTERKAQRVILIGIDGMSADGLQYAHTPTLKGLIAEGACSMSARGVMPTVSSPNWASMLNGAGPEQHGISSNEWGLKRHTIEPVTADSEGYFPSIFSLIREQTPQARMAAFYDWAGLGELFNKKYLDKYQNTANLKETFEAATPYVLQEKPDFTFIYLGLPDEEGHAHGWESEAYFKSLEEVDHKIGEFIAALKSANLYDDTYIIVVTDHGGVGRAHGGESMTEIQVPWIIRGPGVIGNRLISQPLNSFDTAPTIAYLFGLKQPPAWIGKPVLGAFTYYGELANENKAMFLPKPKGNIRSGFYVSPQSLSFTVDAKDAEVYYTLDGSIPTAISPKFAAPVLLNNTGTIKAIAKQGKLTSSITVIDFKLLAYQPAVKVRNAKAGLRYDYFEGTWLEMPDFTLLKPKKSGISITLDLISLKEVEDHYGIVFTGYLALPQQGMHTFYLTSDDGSKLYIDDSLIVNNDGSHGVITKVGIAALDSGYHKIVIEYFEDYEGEELSLEMEGPGFLKQAVTTKMLSH